MNIKTLSLILMAGGGLLALVSLLADLLGIGSYPGFHGAQVGGLAVGLFALVYGYLLYRRTTRVKK